MLDEQGRRDGAETLHRKALAIRQVALGEMHPDTADSYNNLAANLEARGDHAAAERMDNLGSHKGPAVRNAIRAVGARLLFLPPYSPDLNPIEQIFAKRKLLLRKAAQRSVEATWRRIGSLLDAFPPHECANDLRNSGYASA